MVLQDHLAAVIIGRRLRGNDLHRVAIATGNEWLHTRLRKQESDEVEQIQYGRKYDTDGCYKALLKRLLHYGLTDKIQIEWPHGALVGSADLGVWAFLNSFGLSRKHEIAKAITVACLQFFVDDMHTKVEKHGRNSDNSLNAIDITAVEMKYGRSYKIFVREQTDAAREYFNVSLQIVPGNLVFTYQTQAPLTLDGQFPVQTIVKKLKNPKCTPDGSKCNYRNLTQLLRAHPLIADTYSM